MIQVEKITDREAFARLECEWNALLAHSASNTITLTHEWLLTWWDVFGEGRELCLLLARQDGKLVGIAPLLERPVHRWGVPMRRIEFLASGEDEADEICSDYLDFIIQSGQESEVLTALLNFLERDEGWDELLLTDISGESANLTPLRQWCQVRSLSCEVTREQTCIFVPLPASRDELLTTISSQKRKRLQKDRRTVAEQNMRVQKVDNSEDFEAAFQILVDLHQERWTSRGFPGSFSSEKFMRFHRQLAPQMLKRGWLQLWVLWQADAPLCAVYDFVYAGKISHYQSGFGALETPLLQPGMLIRDYAIEDGICQGIVECDFLKGEVGGYKMSWGGQTRPIVQIRVARGGAKEAIFQGISRLVDQARPWRRRVLQVLKKKNKGE